MHGTLPKRSRTPIIGRRVTMTSLAMPSLLLMVVVNAYPLIFAVVQSFHDGSLMALGPYVGLENYSNVLTDRIFWGAAWFTIIFTVCGVFGSWLLGFALALLLKPDFPGKNFFKVLLLLPWIVPIVVTSMSWNWLIASRDSILPVIARTLGFGNVMFLANPTMAAVSVCVLKIWISYPFMMMMCAGALETVETSLYEASNIDGANRWQQLIYIVMPVTARSTYISWILMALFSANDFATIWLMTHGGPVNATTSLVVLAYRTFVFDFLPGEGLAVAFLLTSALIALSALLLRQIQKANLQ